MAGVGAAAGVQGVPAKRGVRLKRELVATNSTSRMNSNSSFWIATVARDERLDDYFKQLDEGPCRSSRSNPRTFRTKAISVGVAFVF